MASPWAPGTDPEPAVEARRRGRAPSGPEGLIRGVILIAFGLAAMVPVTVTSIGGEQVHLFAVFGVAIGIGAILYGISDVWFFVADRRAT